VDGLPSWVPDWRHEIPCLVLGRLNNSNEFHFDASGIKKRYSTMSKPRLDNENNSTYLLIPTLPSISADSSYLHLNGFSFDTISAISSNLFISDIYEKCRIPFDHNAAYDDFWKALTYFLKDNRAYSAISDRDCYLRTVCANLEISDFFRPGGRGWDYGLSFIAPLYRSTRSVMLAKRGARSAIDIALSSWVLMQRMRTKRCLIVTRGGHLGIAPSWVKEGDEVCVLTGGSVPLVLRQTVL
jgi:hypothetical protein